MSEFCLRTGELFLLLGLLVVATKTSNGQVIWDRAHIDQIRKHAADTPVRMAVENLREAADAALEEEPYSVIHKDIVPPSGDKHDYLSFSRYWWPDPDKPDGLPYIRKDGVVNWKLIANGDRVRLGHFRDDVQALALAGYILKDPRYTRHAAKMVQTWFLDEETRMNPNLNFGQGVPGRAHGRGPGIIDTRGFILVLDSIELFDEKHWSAKDQRKLQEWFDDYQRWMEHSALGQHEQQAKNNHGSWYAAQRSRYALFAGRKDLARKIVQQAKKRIDEQFKSNGDQAEELKRTRSLHYSLFNITALSRVARVGDRVGENLWEFEPEHGCTLKKALDGLLPYLTGERAWQHQQIDKFSFSPSSRVTLRLFARHFNDDKYRKLEEKIAEVRHAERDFSCLMIGTQKEAVLER